MVARGQIICFEGIKIVHIAFAGKLNIRLEEIAFML